MTVDLSYYNNLLLNANIQAFLKVIRKGEGTLSSSGYSTTFGGGQLSTLSVIPTIDTFYTNSNGVRGSVVGAYQFGNSSSNPTLPNLVFKFQWNNFSPINQDIGAIELIKEKNAINNIVSGDITTAISKLNNPLWPSLPGGSQQQQNLNSALSFYVNNGGTLNSTDTNTMNSGISYGTATNSIIDSNLTDQQKQFKINLQAIENSVTTLEINNSDYSWGARQNTTDFSDWIGLRQFLMYLATTYEPQSMIPFVELIPKFFMDESQNYSQQQAQGDNLTNQQYQISDVQKNKFLKTKNLFNALNNMQGGIDLLTIDPFQDINAFNNKNTTVGTTNAGTNTPNIRNFGYRIFGNVVLNPGIQGDETSKAGPIGFKSMEISSGANFLQGLTLVTIKLLDVQGNKFLDITSPWSFLLNASQINGDFYFRYGWQIRIPEFDKNNKDKTSTSYKFWNHPGWAVFGDRNSKETSSTDTILRLKNEIYTKSQKSGTGVLNLTQSPNINSIELPGYQESVQSQDNNGINTGLFTITRKLSIEDYLIISMINPELSINSEDGSVTATIQFRMNTAMANCMCYLADCKQIHSLINDSKNSKITLENLMRAFITDNKNYILQDNKLKKYKDNIIDTTQPTVTWVTVRNLQSNLIDAKDIKINISTKKIKELSAAFNSPSSQKNNITGRAWITEVCSENGLTLVSSGDPGSVSAANSSAFQFIYDDKNNNAVSNPNSTDNDAASGFLGNGNINRIVLQDDVFSFRFRGSLVENIEIENNENPTAQTIENTGNLANSDAGKNTVTSKGTENNDPNKPSPPDPNETVTLSDKNRYMQYLLSKMAAANIKCICHPWLKICNTIYIKGTGYFDGKYIISKLKHTLDNSNKFMSEVVAVRIINDTDYINNQQKINDDRTFAYSNPDTNLAETVQKQTVPIDDKTFVANNNKVIIQKQLINNGQ